MALYIILNETKSLKSRFFMAPSVPLRMTVHARSLRGVENDEAISSTQGDCFAAFAMIPLNGSLRGVPPSAGRRSNLKEERLLRYRSQ